VLPFQREFGLSSSEAALPGSLATGAMLVTGPIVGFLTDRYGTCVSVLCRCALLSGAALSLRFPCMRQAELPCGS
jgi:MFS family permease